MEKKCLECGKLFEISKYNNYKSIRKSHSFCCKRCGDKYFHREYDKAPEFIEIHNIRARDRQRNKEKKICEKCGSVKNVELHHITYDLDINIIQLICRKCHRELHHNILRKEKIK